MSHPLFVLLVAAVMAVGLVGTVVPAVCPTPIRPTLPGMTVTSPDANKRVVQQLWDELYARDFDAVGAHFLDDGEYTDVPSPQDDVARGPAEIAARLRLGLEPLERIHHEIRVIVAEGDTVVTEHVEHWHWPGGEHVDLPFVSVHVFRDGRVARWWDYWDMQTLMGAAPDWWVEHVMKGYK